MTETLDDRREAARKRIEDRRGFLPHLVVYLFINGTLLFVWANVGPQGFFWPAIVMFTWGIGLVMHAWNAFLRRPITETDIDRELARDADEAHRTDIT
ncbi:MAG TPA: 2TM domain-containing protein [Kutzneria sp.]|jgi:hypothetical protein|nr:2TM domain-containing protein [Kutzneria sp.]